MGVELEDAPVPGARRSRTRRRRTAPRGRAPKSAPALSGTNSPLDIDDRLGGIRVRFRARRALIKFPFSHTFVSKYRNMSSRVSVQSGGTPGKVPLAERANAAIRSEKCDIGGTKMKAQTSRRRAPQHHAACSACSTPLSKAAAQRHAPDRRGRGHGPRQVPPPHRILAGWSASELAEQDPRPGASFGVKMLAGRRRRATASPWCGWSSPPCCASRATDPGHVYLVVTLRRRHRCASTAARDRSRSRCSRSTSATGGRSGSGPAVHARSCRRCPTPRWTGSSGARRRPRAFPFDEVQLRRCCGHAPRRLFVQQCARAAGAGERPRHGGISMARRATAGRWPRC